MCGIKMLCLGSRYSVIVYGIGILSFVVIDKGWSKIKMPHSFCVISMARNMPEGRDVIHSKGEIHSSVWSTKITRRTTTSERNKFSPVVASFR